jgi:segregation and condensation protein A
MTVNVDDTVDGDPDGTARPPSSTPGFEVHLDVFEGPFDLLLALISKHKLDITEVALSQVTDEFIGYISERADGWDLDQVSYFLVVAATLLDLKAARLLPEWRGRGRGRPGPARSPGPALRPAAAVPGLQGSGGVFAARMTAAARRFPRRVPLEPRFAELLPEVLLGLGPAEFARLAALTLAPKPPPKVSTEHIHSPVISIKDQIRSSSPSSKGSAGPASASSPRTRPGQLRGRRVVPGPARAVPGGRCVLRAGHPAWRAVRDLDRPSGRC